jgi:hypothetical protein
MPAALAKLVAGSPSSTGSLTGADARRLLDMTRETFTAYLNTSFRVKTHSGSVKLKLTAVTDLKAISKTPALIAGKESFSLMFEGRSKNSFTQDTYAVEHEVLGTFSLFLVPVGKPANHHYEAIIIRL